MWNLTFSPPQIIEARVLSRLPDAFREARANAWAQANKPGETIDCFLEGPAFDRSGNLFVTDIPYGRIFRIDPELRWTLVAQTGGWPNGLAFHRDGRLFVADYRLGLLAADPATGRVEPLLAHRNSEGFKGLNDLTFDLDGALYFTDQGQTGLHDPTGRVFRYGASGRLDCLIANGPSPNGVAVSPDGRFLAVAMTRANAVWRGPLQPDGSLSKVGAFTTLFGTSGPDGLAYGSGGELVIAHASLGGAFVCNGRGEITHFVQVPFGRTVTNIAFRPLTGELVMTESETGTLFTALLPFTGAPLYSHTAQAEI